MKLTKVYHIGNLNEPRKAPYCSYEGNGLSVSIHPHAWAAIAKLQGELWELKNPASNFLSFTQRSHAKAINWCIQNDFLIRSKKFRVETDDCESDNKISIDFENEEEAIQEAKLSNVPIKIVSGYSFGQRGKDYWLNSFTSQPNNAYAESYAIIHFGENQGYDGIWWNEILDVPRLSAPRAVIFPEKLSGWQIAKSQKQHS